MQRIKQATPVQLLTFIIINCAHLWSVISSLHTVYHIHVTVFQSRLNAIHNVWIWNIEEELDFFLTTMPMFVSFEKSNVNTGNVTITFIGSFFFRIHPTQETMLILYSHRYSQYWQHNKLRTMYDWVSMLTKTCWLIST